MLYSPCKRSYWKNSCVRCHTLGKYENNRVYFPNLDSPLRTHEDFITHSDTEFHSSLTILVNIPNFDVVNDIPFDYMHFVCIGIMKKLLIIWNGGVKRHNLALPDN